MSVENYTKIANFPTRRVFLAPAEMVPLGIWYQHRGRKKTGMMGLPEVGKSFKIGLAVLIQYRHVTDSQPPSQPRCRSKYALCISASRSKNVEIYSELYHRKPKQKKTKCAISEEHTHVKLQCPLHLREV